MGKEKFYKKTTYGLLLLNLGLVVFIIISSYRRMPRPIDAQKLLNLNEQQHQAFLKSAEQHQKAMVNINHAQRELIQQCFNHLIDNNINKDSSIQGVQELEKQKLELTYLHLEEIKGLLNEQQLPHFGAFIQQITRIVLGKNRKRPPPRGGAK